MVRRGTHAVVVVVVVAVSAVVLVVVVDAVVNTMPVWGGSVACCTVRPSRSTYVPGRLTVTVAEPGFTAA